MKRKRQQKIDRNNVSVKLFSQINDLTKAQELTAKRLDAVCEVLRILLVETLGNEIERTATSLRSSSKDNARNFNLT